MKKLPILFSLALAIVMGASSCSTVNGIFTSYYTAKVNGTVWTSTLSSGTRAVGRLTIAGTSINGQVLNILIPDGIAPGTYPMAALGNYTAEYRLGGLDIYTSTVGQLVVTSHDVANKRIVGTFEFTATNVGGTTLPVTEGRFSVSYL